MYLQLLKSLNRLHPRAWDFVQLSRMDRPIGIYLLLWPRCRRYGLPATARQPWPTCWSSALAWY